MRFIESPEENQDDQAMAEEDVLRVRESAEHLGSDMTVVLEYYLSQVMR